MAGSRLEGKISPKPETPIFQQREKGRLPDRTSKTSRTKNPINLATRLWSAPQYFTHSDRSSSTDLTASTRSEHMTTRSRKRDWEGNVKEMVTELKARTDLVLARGKTALEGEGKDHISSLLVAAVNSRTNKGGSAGSEEQTGSEEQHSDGNTKKRKRQGFLLEWRNKEMFEEPLRI